MSVPQAVRSISLALLSAILLVLCFPRFDLDFLAWIALIPLLLALNDKSLPRAFGLAFLTGVIFFVGVFYWINAIEGVRLIDNVLLALYLAPYFGLFGLGLNVVSRHTGLSPVFTAPFLWVSLEYLRSHAGFLALPWALLGHSQYRHLPLVQISSVTGVYGLSFLIVMVNATLAELIAARRASSRAIPPQRHPRLAASAIVTACLLAASLAYGLSLISRPPGRETLTVAVIQGNIPQNARWDLDHRKRNLETHLRLTREAVAAGPVSLTIWPETSVPGALTQDIALMTTLSALARETNSHLLLGSAVRPKGSSGEAGTKRSYNSAFLIAPTGRIAGQYNKLRLVPFGEYLPHKDSIPWPSRYASKAGNFIPGNRYTVLSLDGTGFGVVICWETIFPDLFRRFVLNGARFMVSMTNEAWFGETPAASQLLAIAVFRAAENRIAIARAANTGISGFIDPYGRIIGRVTRNHKDLFVEGHLTRAIPLATEKTFYTRYGDVWASLSLAGTLCMISLAAVNMMIHTPGAPAER